MDGWIRVRLHFYDVNLYYDSYVVLRRNDYSQRNTTQLN